MAADAAAAARLLRTIAADHPAFDGHFPGRPILPGVVLLAEVLEAVRTLPRFAAAIGPTPLLVAAKFLAPVDPGSELTIDLRLDERLLCFDVSVEARPVAKGQLRVGCGTESST